MMFDFESRRPIDLTNGIPLIRWNGIPQPAATLDEVMAMASSGYCDHHSFPEHSSERCECPHHVVTLASGVRIYVPRFPDGQPIMNDDGETVGSFAPRNWELVEVTSD